MKVANKNNLKKYSKDLLCHNYSEDNVKKLLKCETLEDFNSIMECFGVEYLNSISGENDIVYVDTGDTYNTTIVYYHDKMRITSIGDIIEKNMNDYF